MRRARLGSGSNLFLLLALAMGALAAPGCAENSAGGERVTVVRNAEPPPILGGIPPDKQAEIQLLLQQRDTSTLKCYQDVLNDKHDRAFKGSVFVILTINPSGKADDVRVAGGTLNNAEVGQCLVEKLKEFDYPQVPNRGSMQYEYRFEPAY
ncbi:MAG TPA: AgmX/PglI C-terminal domain-containing protein [Polyangia bacterium]|nr:AgmX/PglI C-terminal domain-containing protein [Polyangia bacterium]